MIDSKIVQKISSVLDNNDVQFAGVFGSFARGEDRPDSDIDILVKFSKTKGLFDFSGLRLDLMDALGRKVDLVTDGGLSPLVRPFVEKDLQIIYGTR